MGELIPPESGTQTAPIALWGVHPSAGYPWRYDMGGHQTVLDVALTYGFIANRGEQQSFSGSDVYEEIGLGNKPSRPQHYQHCTSITMHFFIDISMVYNIIEMIND
jgi:hypothetical protein